MTFPELRSSTRDSFAYYGDRTGWLIVLGQHRDSDALARSNWTVISEDMLKRFGDDVAIERFNHWLVGWADSLLVKPGSPAVAAAEDWLNKLSDYPVADEEAYSALEASEEWCVRCDRATAADHPTATCRRFRSDDEAEEIRARWRMHA